jgi:hypothetical protein
MKGNSVVEEEWLPIAGSPDHEVSNRGQVRRRPLKATLVPHGYLRVSLSHKGVTKYKYVHQLVCETFHGPAPRPGMVIAHGDGNKLNNTPENLRWATPAENAADTVKHGRTRRALQHHNAKLSDDDVRQMRQERANGASSVDLAKKWDVHVETARSIVRGAKRALVFETVGRLNMRGKA